MRLSRRGSVALRETHLVFHPVAWLESHYAQGSKISGAIGSGLPDRRSVPPGIPRLSSGRVAAQDYCATERSFLITNLRAQLQFVLPGAVGHTSESLRRSDSDGLIPEALFASAVTDRARSSTR